MMEADYWKSLYDCFVVDISHMVSVQSVFLISLCLSVQLLWLVIVLTISLCCSKLFIPYLNTCEFQFFLSWLSRISMICDLWTPLPTVLFTITLSFCCFGAHDLLIHYPSTIIILYPFHGWHKDGFMWSIFPSCRYSLLPSVYPNTIQPSILRLW